MHVKPELLLRILVVEAPEHEEVLGGRRPALVQRSRLRRRFGWTLGRYDRNGIDDQHFCCQFVSCRTWQRRKGGVFDPGRAECAAGRRRSLVVVGHPAAAGARARALAASPGRARTMDKGQRTKC